MTDPGVLWDVPTRRRLNQTQHAYDFLRFGIPVGPIFAPSAPTTPWGHYRSLTRIARILEGRPVKLLADFLLHDTGGEDGTGFHGRPPYMDLGGCIRYFEAFRAWAEAEGVELWGVQLCNEFEVLLRGDVLDQYNQYAVILNHLAATFPGLPVYTGGLWADGRKTPQGNPGLNDWLAENRGVLNDSTWERLVFDVHLNLLREVDFGAQFRWVREGIPTGCLEDAGDYFDPSRPLSPWRADVRAGIVAGLGGTAYTPFGRWRWPRWGVFSRKADSSRLGFQGGRLDRQGKPIPGRHRWFRRSWEAVDRAGKICRNPPPLDPEERAASAVWGTGKAQLGRARTGTAPRWFVFGAATDPEDLERTGGRGDTIAEAAEAYERNTGDFLVPGGGLNPGDREALQWFQAMDSREGPTAIRRAFDGSFHAEFWRPRTEAQHQEVPSPAGAVAFFRKEGL